jgi:hypothetical protein
MPEGYQGIWEQVNLLVKPRQSLPGILDFGNPAVNVFPEAEEVLMIYACLGNYFPRPILLKRSVYQGAERTGSNLRSFISNAFNMVT